MEMALTFNDFTFSPVSYQDKIWIKATELARVLGYSRDNLITRLYHSNEDEFTPEMTQVIEISDSTDSAPPTKARIFSLRGCHLLSMFARTPIAKAFRKWVLDVLDRLAKEESEKAPNPDCPYSLTITPEQQRTLQGIVDAKVRQASGANNPIRRELYAQTWHKLKNQFLIAKYQQLPQTKFAEAIAFLVQLEIQPKKQKSPHEDAIELCKRILGTDKVEDKYESYIHDVESFRAETAAKIDVLLHRGLNLVDGRKLGAGGVIALTPVLLDWLQRVAGQPSPILRRNEPVSRAIDYSPLYLLRHLEKVSLPS